MTNSNGAALSGTTTLYTYLLFPARLGNLLPAWLWEKMVRNVSKVERAMPAKSKESNIEIFKSEAVDINTLVDDLEKQGYTPCHIHMMRRQNGNLRVRVTWMKSPADTLTKEEISWVKAMFRRFVWDSMLHRSLFGTEHLPPHLALNCAYPTERDRTTSVESVQVVNGEVALITDPDAVTSSTSIHGREAVMS